MNTPIPVPVLFPFIFIIESVRELRDELKSILRVLPDWKDKLLELTFTVLLDSTVPSDVYMFLLSPRSKSLEDGLYTGTFPVSGKESNEAVAASDNITCFLVPTNLLFCLYISEKRNYEMDADLKICIHRKGLRRFSTGFSFHYACFLI